MRCCTCDKVLSDYESTLKHRTEGYYLDMCVKCLKGLSIPTEGREDLLGAQEPAEEGFNDVSEIDEGNFDLGPMFYEDD